MSEVKKTKILNYINVFRGLAILLIVAGHTMQFGEIGSLTQRISVEIFAGGTALFIFISGFLFQHLSGKYEFKSYMSKKWTNVILPYLWTAIPGLIFCFTMPIRYENTLAGLNPIAQIPMLLSVGRIHNVPTWFIPMIFIFFLSSWLLIKLEKKGVLYKFLPLFFLITIFLQRPELESHMLQDLSYTARWFEYVKYVFIGYMHFFSMYVFGMFCSANKNIIDKFWQYRWFYITLMFITASLNVYSGFNGGWTNGTLSKIFLTIIALAYLKHYDDCIISHKNLNKNLDIIAKYSFGIFFIHWYIFFIYNLVFNLPNVLPVTTSIPITFGYVLIRFIAVTLFSLLTLWGIKQTILKLNPESNTRSFIGV
ncbi:MAG: acyltransferase [Cyanobacteria bacterium SIG31]|nr:acyltransferase [Cyanobacteria bacterium SIG31]